MPGSLIRSAILSGARERLRARGQSPARITRQCGLPAEALVDPDLLVDGGAVMRFFEIAAKACGDRNWGLSLSLDGALAAILGPLWILLRNARTLRQMCEDLAQNFDIYSDAALMSFETVAKGGFLTWTSATGRASSEVQIAEFALAIFLKEIRLHTPREWTPPAVHFRHSAPAKLQLHRKIFGPNLRFDSDRNAIQLDDAILDRPLRQLAPHTRGFVRELLRHDDEGRDVSTRLRVEGIVRSLLPYTPCNLIDVSRAMAMSTRTLQVRLRAEGTSFKAIKDAVRADLALKYLRHSKMSATQIAEILGYTYISSFSRSFRRWHRSTAIKERRSTR